MDEQSVNTTAQPPVPAESAPEGSKIFTPAGFFTVLGVMWIVAFLAHLIIPAPEWRTDWAFMVATLIFSIATLIHGRL